MTYLQLAKVREVAQAEQQRVHDAVRDVEQGVEKARAQLLQQSQAQMQELQKEINAEHRYVGLRSTCICIQAYTAMSVL